MAVHRFAVSHTSWSLFDVPPVTDNTTRLSISNLPLLPMSRQPRHVCQVCETILVGRTNLRWRYWSQARPIPCLPFASAASTKALKPATQQLHPPFANSRITPQLQPGNISSSELELELRQLQRHGTIILSPTAPTPSAQQSEAILNSCERLARRLLRAQEHLSKDSADLSSHSSMLLNLEEDKSKPIAQSAHPNTSSKKRLMDTLSDLAYRIVSHPPVFLSPQSLQSYVTTQCLLNRPQTLADVFILYAKKPIIQEGTTPAIYKTPNPKRAQFAIPATLADSALKAAIRIRDLHLALAIIETTYGAPAFRRSKFIRKALLPLTGLSLAPFAAYTVASYLAAQQNNVETELATNIAFAGIVAYIGFTATIGIVAVTTANDQMDRVTWATGTPLRERWLREEERAALDKVAGAWGFKDRLKRGEEEGEEWDGLREWIGRSRMVLDRVELMEGMQ